LARVIWTAESRDNLRAIHSRISEDSRRAADALIEQIVSSTDQLSEFPLSGRVVPEFNEEDMRELMVRNYRVVYQVIGETVGIVRVHHGARLLRPSDIEQD
jgi:addiction module RelE/StbE family toxin